MSTALQPGGSSGAAAVPVPGRPDPRILVDGAHGRHQRWWRPGERLEHLLSSGRAAVRAAARGGIGRPALRRRAGGCAHLHRRRRPREPARASPAAARPRIGPPRGAAVRRPRAGLRRHARRAQGRRRLRAARPRVPGRPHRLHRLGRRGDGRAVAVSPAPAPGGGPGGGRRHRRRSPKPRRAEPCPGDGRGARARARRAGLHHLHLRLHGTAEGRGGRAPQHRQLRLGRRRGVRLPTGRPCLPGPDDRIRLLLRGDLGAVGGRGDARAEAPGRQPARRRPARLPHRAPGQRDVLRADAAGHRRGRPPRAALPAGVGRGLPARPHRASRPTARSSTSAGSTSRSRSGVTASS